MLRDGFLETKTAVGHRASVAPNTHAPFPFWGTATPMPASSWILTALSTTRVSQDTLVVVTARDAFDWINGATASALLLLLVLLVAILIGMLMQIRSVIRSVEAAGASARNDPAFAHLRNTVANVEALSARARSEGDRLADAVGSFSERLDQASAHVETRIDAFNALLEVVQEEAEASFVDAASKARGVRGGMDHLGQTIRRRGATETTREDSASEEDSAPEEGLASGLGSTP